MALLINNRQFEEYFEDVEFVVHITHHDVLMTPQYQNWMHNFCTIKVSYYNNSILLVYEPFFINLARHY